MDMIEKFKQIRNNKNAKTLASNFLYLSILKGISFLFPLITLPYLARVIGADYFGAIAFASSITIIIETITDWGFNYTATRDVAKERNDLKQVSTIFSEVMCARFFLAIICFIVLLISISIIPSLNSYKTLLIFTYLYIPGNILFPQWLFQAFERMRYITILSFISKLIFTCLVFVIIKKQSDYIYQPLLIAAGFLTSGIIAQYIIYKTFKIKLVRFSLKSVLNRIKESTDMFINILLPNLYTNFSTIILKTYCGDVATGIYNGAQRFQSIIDSITTILSMTFFPFLVRHKEKHKVYVLISGTIAVVGSLLMFFGAELFVKIFLTEEFESSVNVIRIFALTPIFLFLTDCYGTNYLVVIGKEIIMRNIILVVSLLGFALTWWLTPTYSYIGAATTVTVARGLRGIATFYFAKREVLKSHEINKLDIK